MSLITRDELRAKIDRGDDFKLVMVLGEWQYRAKHIPGSINISSPNDPLALELKKEEEIVVYCSDASCSASAYAYQTLLQRGFTKVRRYAGGVSDWENAGYPLEGEWVASRRTSDPEV
jgi:rhodanese-related sulfurtransferase